MAEIPPRLLECEHMAIKQCRHGHFLYSTFDSFVGRALDLYGEWCEPEASTLCTLVKPGSIVVDAGANIGSLTVPLARRVGPSGRVYAFEPQRQIFQQLCANVAMNGLNNVYCVPEGLGATPGLATVSNVAPGQNFNFGGVKLNRAGDVDTVPVTTIDLLDLPTCQMIKVDVEGMEAAVLAGAEATIEKFHPLLYVENNKADRSAEVIAAVRRHAGYRAYWHIFMYYSPGNFFGNPTNVFEDVVPDSNMLCIYDPAGAIVSPLPPVVGDDDTWLEAVRRMETKTGE
jgi:FkbM family methyltransferase